jgi:phosphatidylglycerophosphate synthase
MSIMKADATTATAPAPHETSMDRWFFALLKPLWPWLLSHREKWYVRQLPNAITVSLRLIPAIPICWMLMLAFEQANGGRQIAFLGIVIICSFISDGIDGSIARRLNIESRFGRIVDPIADKLLVVCLLWVFMTTGQAILPSTLATIFVSLIWIRIIVDVILVSITAAEAIQRKAPRAEAWGKRKLAVDGLNTLVIIIGLGFAANDNSVGNQIIAVSCLGLITASYLGIRSIGSHWRNLHS